VIIEALYMPVVLITEEYSMLDGSSVSISERPLIKNLGARIISEYHGLGVGDFGARIEVGMRPGVLLPVNKDSDKLSNLYFSIGIFGVINKK
jgi:hypothetical protein